MLAKGSVGPHRPAVAILLLVELVWKCFALDPLLQLWKPCVRLDNCSESG